MYDKSARYTEKNVRARQVSPQGGLHILEICVIIAPADLCQPPLFHYLHLAFLEFFVQLRWHRYWIKAETGVVDSFEMILFSCNSVPLLR